MLDLLFDQLFYRLFHWLLVWFFDCFFVRLWGRFMICVIAWDTAGEHKVIVFPIKSTITTCNSFYRMKSYSQPYHFCTKLSSFIFLNVAPYARINELISMYSEFRASFHKILTFFRMIASQPYSWRSSVQCKSFIRNKYQNKNFTVCPTKQIVRVRSCAVEIE